MPRPEHAPSVARHDIVGIRPGEKLHEQMIGADVDPDAEKDDGEEERLGHVAEALLHPLRWCPVLEG